MIALPEHTLRDTLLLVGNGLAIDYRNRFPAVPDPSRPLDYPLLTPGKEGRPLRETFAELWETIEALRAKEPGISDFKLMERLRLLPVPPLPMFSDKSAFQLHHQRALVEWQLRLHLMHAYVKFTQSISDTDLQSWRWHQWLLRNKDRLHTVVSFNYDLLIERAIQSITPIRYIVEQQPRVSRIRHGVSVFKPHGSINLEFATNVVRDNPEKRYERKNVFDLSNVPIRFLDAIDLDCQRLNTNIVLPTEASRIRQFQYIAPGFCFLKKARSEISRCIIAGISYWNCDQPEINEILTYLWRNTQIVVCNPSPPQDLEIFLTARFQQVQTLKVDLPV